MDHTSPKKEAAARRSRGIVEHHRAERKTSSKQKLADDARTRNKKEETIESYDMLDGDFVEELREGWDDLGDSRTLVRDEETAKWASSQALLAQESFVATTYSLAKEFLWRLVGGTGTDVAKFGTTTYSRRG